MERAYLKAVRRKLVLVFFFTAFLFVSQFIQGCGSKQSNELEKLITENQDNPRIYLGEVLGDNAEIVCVGNLSNKIIGGGLPRSAKLITDKINTGDYQIENVSRSQWALLTIENSWSFYVLYKDDSVVKWYVSNDVFTLGRLSARCGLASSAYLVKYDVIQNGNEQWPVGYMESMESLVPGSGIKPEALFKLQGFANDSDH